MESILFVVCEQIKNISILLSPIIPVATEKVLKIMNLNIKKLSLDDIQNMKNFNHDKELNKLDILFSKIEK